MATATGTKRTSSKSRKPTPSPFTLSDHLNAWYSGLRSRVVRKLRKAWHFFIVSSAIAFWSTIAGYLLASYIVR